MQRTPKQEWDNAVEAISAAAEGRGDLNDAQSAFLGITDYRIRGMNNPEWDSEIDPADRLFSQAANSFKMAIDALSADQDVLARSYVKVGRLKLNAAREAAGES